ncbi:MAG: DUF3078 domain-containing protein [Paludibacteraceae bacterium]
MKKIALFLGLYLIFGMVASSQITDAESKLKKVETDTVASWKKGGFSGLNFSQTSLTNWAAGGQNSLALNGLFNFFAVYKDTLNVWENTLDLGYGFLRQSSYDGIMKTDDRIEFNSKYGRKAFKNFYYAGLLNFRTQFSPGYNYPNDVDKISNFMAPGYLLAALGLNYIPNTYFNAFLSPLTGRLTFVLDEALSQKGAFGVAKGEKRKKELGGYVRLAFAKSDFKQGFFQNMSIGTKVDLFSNYLKDPQYVDVNWETLLGMKVNKYITVSLNTQLIYDHDVRIDYNQSGSIDDDSPRVQFKEILGIGFMYKF